MRMKFTTSKLDSLKPPETGELLVWDEGLAGFGVRVGQRRRTFVVQYRGRSGRSRRLKLGTFPALSLAGARAKAAAALAAVERGEEPSAEGHEQRHTPTLREFTERYVAEGHPSRTGEPKRRHTAASEASLLRAHLLPAFGAKPLDAITERDVRRFHAGLRERRYVANRALALLRHMLFLARTWGVLEKGHPDPTAGVKLYREEPRERWLTASEAERLGAALRAEEARDPLAAAGLKLLALTGARASEVRLLRWAELDLEGACLRLPAERTKEKRAKVLPLTAPALAVLAALPRLDDELVFPGARDGRPRSFQYAWNRVRKAAGLDCRMHDLRHAFATAGVGAGMGLPMIGSLLGHRQAATTQRYAHAADDPRREAAERIAGRVAASLDGKPAEVVPLRGAQR